MTRDAEHTPSPHSVVVPVSAIVGFDVEEYVGGYEFRGDEGGYMPTDKERELITDAIHGVMSELSCLSAPAPSSLAGGEVTNDQIQSVMLAAIKEVRATVTDATEGACMDADIIRMESGLVDMGDTGWAVMRSVHRRLAALSPEAPAGEVPDDVRRLVIAARNVAFDDPTQAELRALDIASEAFASRIPWDDEPDALTPRHEAPASEDEARRKLINCIDQWDSEMEYDAEDRACLADDILHAFNGPPVVSHEAPAEGAFSAGQVWKDPHTDRWIADVEERGSAVVAAQAIGEDEDQAEARRDLILAALTRRHEAPVSVWDAIRSHPCYGEHQPGCDCVIPAQTETEVPPFLKRMTDAKYEAPAEGAGDREGEMDDDDASTYAPSVAGLSDYLWNQAQAADSVEGRCILEMWREAVDALRARSSAPEAREGEA